MLRELVTNKRVMLLSGKVPPSSVAEFDKSLRRLNNVRE